MPSKVKLLILGASALVLAACTTQIPVSNQSSGQPYPNAVTNQTGQSAGDQADAVSSGDAEKDSADIQKDLDSLNAATDFPDLSASDFNSK